MSTIINDITTKPSFIETSYENVIIEEFNYFPHIPMTRQGLTEIIGITFKVINEYMQTFYQAGLGFLESETLINYVIPIINFDGKYFHLEEGVLYWGGKIFYAPFAFLFDKNGNIDQDDIELEENYKIIFSNMTPPHSLSLDGTIPSHGIRDSSTSLDISFYFNPQEIPYNTRFFLRGTDDSVCEGNFCDKRNKKSLSELKLYYPNFELIPAKLFDSHNADTNFRFKEEPVRLFNALDKYYSGDYQSEVNKNRGSWYKFSFTIKMILCNKKLINSVNDGDDKYHQSQLRDVFNRCKKTTLKLGFTHNYDYFNSKLLKLLEPAMLESI